MVGSPTASVFHNIDGRRLNASVKLLNVFVKSRTMMGLIYIYGTIAAVAAVIAVWFHTPWGKKFLKDL